jgi:hypothetical protein
LGIFFARKKVLIQEVFRDFRIFTPLA